MRTLYLCGAGNSEGVRLALRVNEARALWDRILLLDDDPSRHGSALLGVEVVGGFGRLADADPATDATVNLVARTTAGRRRAGERIASFGIPAAGLVDPGVDTLGATLAPDALVYPHAILGPESEVGPGSVVFMGAVVGHEARVGAGCVVAANAVLNARVRLGDGVYVGSAAAILPEIDVGAGATIGAASAVVDHVSAGATVMGVPARTLMSAQDAGAGAASGTSALDPAELEALLQRAWADVLGLPAVDPTAHVFDFGVTSLAALQVAERVAREGGLELAVTDLFRFASIRELVRHLTAERSGPARGRRGPGRRPERSPVAATARPGAEVGVGTETNAAGGGFAGDVDELEVVVTGVFREVLATPEAGPDSHFFDTGGDAGTAQDACRALQGITGEPLCFMQIARYPTPRELARHLVAAAGQPPTCPAQGVMNRLIHRHEWQRG